jgi:inosine-uridine nucleoside N-ribohydrolase
LPITEADRIVKLHLDTDFGGDPDDACALTMLLGWPGVELVGITTVLDVDGLRAAYVAHVLALARREGIPVAAGAGISLTTPERADPVVGDERHWPLDLPPRPSPPGAALKLLARSVEAGATLVAIVPLTNLAMLEMARPGILVRARVVVMGGWLRPPTAGLPGWGPEMDFNVQWDTRAAAIVAATAGNLTLVPPAAALPAHLRTADLPRLRSSGTLGALLASQSEAHAEEYGMSVLGRDHVALPDDLLNFHYDPIACAVAVGWPGAVVEEARLRLRVEGGLASFRSEPKGRPVRVIVDADGERFREAWIAAVEAAQRQAAGGEPMV